MSRFLVKGLVVNSLGTRTGVRITSCAMVLFLLGFPLGRLGADQSDTQQILRVDPPALTFDKTDKREVEVRAELENASAREVSISGVRKTCGCVSTSLDKETLLPGEKTKLSVTVARKSPGILDAAVYLVLQCPERKYQKISVKGEFSWSVDVPFVFPAGVDIHLDSSDPAFDQVFKLSRVDGTKPETIQAVTSSDWIKIRLMDRSNQRNAYFHVEGKVPPGVGLRAETIRISVTSPPWTGEIPLLFWMDPLVRALPAVLLITDDQKDYVIALETGLNAPPSLRSCSIQGECLTLVEQRQLSRIPAVRSTDKHR